MILRAFVIAVIWTFCVALPLTRAGTISGLPSASLPIGPSRLLLDQGAGCALDQLPCATVQAPFSALEQSPAAFGGSLSAADNSGALLAALNASASTGQQVYLDGLYKSAAAITINGCPNIRGLSSTQAGILFTGAGSGLTINCSGTQFQLTTGHVFLSNFGIYTSVAGGGTALTLNFFAQPPATIPLTNLDMEYVHISGDNVNTHYWNNGVVVTNGEQINMSYNYVAGDENNLTHMTAGFTFSNTSGVPAMGVNVIANSIYDTATAIGILSNGTLGTEGYVFRDNLLVTNNTAISIISAGYTPPSFLIVGNQTNSVVQSIALTNVAQIYIEDNTLYVSGTAANDITLVNAGVIYISHNYMLAYNTSTGSGVSGSVSARYIWIIENYAQGFASTATFDSTVNNVYVNGNIANNVTGTAPASAFNQTLVQGPEVVNSYLQIGGAVGPTQSAGNVNTNDAAKTNGGAYSWTDNGTLEWLWQLITSDSTDRVRLWDQVNTKEVITILHSASSYRVGIGNATPGFPLDVGGTVNATAYDVGGVAGLACSGSPTSSFASVGGIVTHC